MSLAEDESILTHDYLSRSTLYLLSFFRSKTRKLLQDLGSQSLEKERFVMTLRLSILLFLNFVFHFFLHQQRCPQVCQEIHSTVNSVVKLFPLKIEFTIECYYLLYKPFHRECFYVTGTYHPLPNAYLWKLQELYFCTSSIKSCSFQLPLGVD